MSYEEKLDYRAALKARELGFYDESLEELGGESAPKLLDLVWPLPRQTGIGSVQGG